MTKNLSFFLGIICVFAGSAFSQSPKVAGPNSTARLTSLEADLARYLELDDDDETPLPTRPRVARTAAVRSSVVVNGSAVARAAFDLINRKRAENGLSQLTWNDDLARVATGHSANMAEYSFFSHKGLDSKLVSDRADAEKVGRWRAIGENIAFNRGFADPAAKTVELWLDSSAHRRNMLSPDWKESAIGVAINEDGAYYFTQVFLVRK